MRTRPTARGADRHARASATTAVLAILLPTSLSAFESAQEPTAATARSATAQEIRFESGDVTLAGWLRLPDTSPPHPAVVLLPGSRPTAKEDERLSTVAAAFVARGFAVLTTDSRGTGESQGKLERASFETLAEDAATAVTALRARPDVRANAVGIWGVSQGATWVGPLAAERAGAAFLVAASGSLASPESHTHAFLAARLRSAGDFDEVTIERITQARRALWRYYATGEGYEGTGAIFEALRREPWFSDSGLPAAVRAPAELGGLPAGVRTFLAQKDFDPLAALSRLSCPVLAVYGAEDSQLPVAEHVEALRKLALESGARIAVEALPGVGHDLRPASADPVGEEGTVEAFERMARWAAEQIDALAAARSSGDE